MTNRIENTVLNLILENFPDKSLKILELTPGEGNLTRELLSNGYANIEAMDIDPDNFNVEGIKCHKGDLDLDLPFENGGFDLVISVEGIEHLEHQYHYAEEIARILKPDGYVVLTTPNINNFASRIKFLFTGFYALADKPNNEFEKKWYYEHIYPITFWQLRHILHTKGLFIKKITTDHIRRSALVGILFLPLSRWITGKKILDEPHKRQFEMNKQIQEQIHSKAIYFGRTQVVLAQKQEFSYKK